MNTNATTLPRRALHLPTPRIGLGLAALGRPGYINLNHQADLPAERSKAAMRAHCHQMLSHAYQRGVRYFDAARSYGLAEDFLGDWLQQTANVDDCVIGSKWGYTYTADWQVDAKTHEVKEHSLAVLQQQWQQTVTHLRCNPALYQIHSATLDSGVLVNTDVLDELARLRDAGVAIGLTTSGPEQADVIEQALAVERDGVGLFSSVQATFNLLEPSAAGALQRAHQAGVRVIIKEALANGRLTMRNQSPGDHELIFTLAELGEEHDVGLDALALGYILQQPWVDMALSGAATPEQLDENLAALNLTLSEQERETLSGFAQPAKDYWQARAALRWN